MPEIATRYSPVMQAQHWLTAILVLLAFLLGPGGSEERIYSSARDLGRQWHETLGLSVFALTLVRGVWRLFVTPPAPPSMPQWMERAARAVQLALYGMLFALPITAICGAWLEGHPLTLLFGVSLAPALPTLHTLGVVLTTLHTWLGDAILWLAGVHAAAALLHHFIMRDNVLLSMLPRRFTSRDR